MTYTDQVVLECSSLSKSYGMVKALDRVSLTLRAGEVRALLGMNGAGKSTLVNLISGSQRADEGTIRVNGTQVQWGKPSDARANGIAIVHQEFSLVPGLSVAENITLGRWPRRRRTGFIDRHSLEEQASRALGQLGETLPLWLEVGRLPIAQQQIVEIAKALLDAPKVLILDEPTSALNANEVQSLLALLRHLARQGVAIIYVSHRMKEIPLVADTMTVLRDGREVQTLSVADASPEKVASLIAGEAGKTAAPVHHRDRKDQTVVLSVRGGHIPGALEDASFDLHDGEVLGIAGLLGAGRTELLEGIYGVRRDFRGDVIVNGKTVSRRGPRRMLARGLGMTPEDRKGAGIVPLLGVGENIVLSARGRVLPKFWIRAAMEATSALATVKKLSIASSSPAQPIATLSGGNQQKAVIGRLLAAKMSILLLDEPTRGIDVHAKSQIYTLIRDLARAGVSSVFVSSELEELSEVCDRVLVLRDGRIQEEVFGAEATTERLLALAMKEGS